MFELVLSAEWAFRREAFQARVRIDNEFSPGPERSSFGGVRDRNRCVSKPARQRTGAGWSAQPKAVLAGQSFDSFTNYFYHTPLMGQTGGPVWGQEMRGPRPYPCL